MYFPNPSHAPGGGQRLGTSMMKVHYCITFTFLANRLFPSQLTNAVVTIVIEAEGARSN